eukprot:m.171107 g.171107  ORF g.171107 m.171107 type:complete len:459 (+) comp9933_c1_seq7:184-1560(+)
MCAPLLLAAIACLTACTHAQSPYTFVSLPSSPLKNVQSALISTFPASGIFTTSTGAQFMLASCQATYTCGPNSNTGQVCNVWDAFTLNTPVTIAVNITGATVVSTLMNAYFYGSMSGSIATIDFSGTGGASKSYSVVQGVSVRDYADSIWSSTIQSTTGINTTQVFSCTSPACLGGAGTFNVNTGNTGTYHVDQQDFDLGPSFVGQTLTGITITRVSSLAQPVIFAMSVRTQAPRPSTCVAACTATISSSSAVNGFSNFTARIGGIELGGAASFVLNSGVGNLVSGNPGETSTVTVLSHIQDSVYPISGLSFVYQYLTAGAATVRAGANFTVSIVDVCSGQGTVVYRSPELTDYSYDNCTTCYSPAVGVALGGLSIPVQAKSAIQFTFYNNNRGLRLKLPLSIAVQWGLPTTTITTTSTTSTMTTKAAADGVTASATILNMTRPTRSSSTTAVTPLRS